MEFHVLGTSISSIAARPGHCLLAVLTLLVLNAGRIVTTEALIDASNAKRSGES